MRARHIVNSALSMISSSALFSGTPAELEVSERQTWDLTWSIELPPRLVRYILYTSS